VLTLRRDDPDLFARGAYRALVVKGPAARSSVAYARILDSRAVVIGAFRHGSIAAETLSRCRIDLDASLAGLQWTDIFTTRQLPPQHSLAAEALFGPNPIAMLHGRAAEP
jgi:maltooligosyltrehalose synthase